MIQEIKKRGGRDHKANQAPFFLRVKSVVTRLKKVRTLVAMNIA